MKKKIAIGGALLLAALGFCAFQTAPILSAAYWPNSIGAGNIPVVASYISGVPVIADSGINAVASTVRAANTAASTTATTLAVTMTGVSTSSKCTFSAANSSAGTQSPTLEPYYTPTANTVTLTFAAAPTAGAIFTIHCIG